MIEIENISKHFDDTAALSKSPFEYLKESIWIAGNQRSGKSTLLRVMAGILKADAGTVRIDGEDAYENPGAKERFFYLPDDPYYFPTATMEDMPDSIRSSILPWTETACGIWRIGWNWISGGRCVHFPRE